MTLTDHQIGVLQERYGWLRQESIMRMENRYKLIQASFTLIPLIGGLIWQFQLYVAAYPACILTLLMAIVFFAESQHVVLIANYLAAIEKRLDQDLQVQPPGWERYSQVASNKKPAATRLLVVGFGGYFLLAISTFNAIGLLKFDDLSLTLRIVLSSVFEGVAIFSTVIAVISYVRFWKSPSDPLISSLHQG